VAAEGKFNSSKVPFLHLGYWASGIGEQTVLKDDW